MAVKAIYDITTIAVDPERSKAGRQDLWPAAVFIIAWLVRAAVPLLYLHLTRGLSMRSDLMVSPWQLQLGFS
jgi:hypothetical protein